MKTEHISNLISLVAMAVDQIHRGHDSAIEKSVKHLELQELYGDVPEDIKRHVDNCLTSIHSNLER